MYLEMAVKDQSILKKQKPRKTKETIITKKYRNKM